MLKEFKEFAFKGNMIDMAVGIIIGGAFGTVVKSLVDDVFMPAIGAMTGGIDFSSKFINLSGTSYDSYTAAREAGAAVIGYGAFLTALISFVLLAFAVFVIVKKALGAMKKEAEAKAETPAISPEEKLLTEIRDLLKQRGA